MTDPYLLLFQRESKEDPIDEDAHALILCGCVQSASLARLAANPFFNIFRGQPIAKLM